MPDKVANPCVQCSCINPRLRRHYSDTGSLTKKRRANNDYQPVSYTQSRQWPPHRKSNDHENARIDTTQNWHTNIRIVHRIPETTTSGKVNHGLWQFLSKRTQRRLTELRGGPEGQIVWITAQLHLLGQFILAKDQTSTRSALASPDQCEVLHDVARDLQLTGRRQRGPAGSYMVFSKEHAEVHSSFNFQGALIAAQNSFGLEFEAATESAVVFGRERSSIISSKAADLPIFSSQAATASGLRSPSHDPEVATTRQPLLMSHSEVLSLWLDANNAQARLVHWNRVKDSIDNLSLPIILLQHLQSRTDHTVCRCVPPNHFISLTMLRIEF